ncbi:MAG: LCP family protein [Actinomycetota bacterium]
MTDDRLRGDGSDRSPLVAAALSALFPGAGQWYAGRRLRGAAFATPAIVLFLYAIVGLVTGTIGFRSIATWAVQPDVLRAWLFVGFAVTIWRIAAVADAYAVVRGRRLAARFVLPVLGILFVLVVLPQAVASAYTVRAISLLEEVFVIDEIDEAPEPAPTVAVTFPPQHEDFVPDPRTMWDDPVAWEFERSTRNLLFREGFGDPDAVAEWVDIIAPPTPDAPFLPFEERVDADRITILLVGADEGPGREGLRTDSMIVATIDVETGDAALFGLPRNLKRIPLPSHLRRAFISLEERVFEREQEMISVDEDEDGYPDHWVDVNGDLIPDPPLFEPCGCFPEMLNKVHQYTETWDQSYPNTPAPGLAALSEVISHLLDLPIDYYFMVNMAGFVDVIDTIGGVDVMVKEPFHVAVSAPSDDSPKARVDVEPGMNHLDGLEALAYSRWRIGSSDYSRMQRQRCLIRAAVDQVDPFTLVRSFHTLADVVERSVVTDIPLSLLPDFVDIVARIDLDRITTVGLVPPRYSAGRAPGGYPIPYVGRIQSKVAEVLEGVAEEQAGNGENECGM